LLSTVVDGIQITLAVVVGCLLASILIVLWRRGRYRYSHMFGVYLGTQLLINLTYLGTRLFGLLGLRTSPDVFDSWGFWATKESIYAAIRMVLLAEITMLVFRALPRARARAQLVLLIATVVLAAALLWPYKAHTLAEFAVDITGRFAYVTIWSLIAILMLVAWHQVPLHPLHKTILYGMLCLMVAHFASGYTLSHWGDVRAGFAHNVVQLLVLGMWFRRVRVAEPVLLPEEIAVVRYLQPWRAQ